MLNFEYTERDEERSLHSQTTERETESRQQTDVWNSESAIEEKSTVGSKSPSEVTAYVTEGRELNFNIFRELEYLQDLIASGTQIPLTELVILDRQLLLDRLNIIKHSLPAQVATAVEITEREREIVRQTEIYIEHLVSSAEARAAEVIDRSTVMRQAEQAAANLKLETERECERLRQMAIAESKDILAGADNYADEVLARLEDRLKNTLNIVTNGRQQLAKSEPHPED